MKASKTRFSIEGKVYNPGDGVPDDVAAKYPHLVDKKEVKEDEKTDEDKQAERINHAIASDGKPPVVAETKEGKKGSVSFSTQTQSGDKKDKK